MTTKSFFNYLTVAISFALLVSPGTALGGIGSKQDNSSVQVRIVEIIDSFPYEELNITEIDGLLLLREEEKLARDVYQFLFAEWGMAIFQNISVSEQRHMDTVKILLDKYVIADPAADNGPGIFTSQELQDLYDELITIGRESVESGLEVGATIEDLDIKDLQNQLIETDNQDISTAYQNLMKGSRNHLRSFVEQLSLLGIEYEAQFISGEEFTSIILTPHEKGLYDQDGELIFDQPTMMGLGRRGRM